jgi:hypothetical protein
MRAIDLRQASTLRRSSFVTGACLSAAAIAPFATNADSRLATTMLRRGLDDLEPFMAVSSTKHFFLNSRM